MLFYSTHLGLNPSSYHAVNIVLHSLVTLCLTLLMKPLIRRPWVRWMTGLAFAAHPIHCEAVASVVGRAELGAALHTLVALLAYRAHLRARRRYRPDKINDHERQDPRFKEIKEYDNDDDDKEEEEEQDREDKEWDKKRKRPAGRQEDEEKEKSLTESNRACRNPFERRQSLLSLFIHRVTICCCCPDLKKSQYRLDSSSSSSPSSSSPFSCNHGQHHQPRPNRQRHQQQPSRRYHQHVERHVDDGRDFRDRCQSGAYLAASLAAAGTAILWKETGMAAIPLCAIMELVQSHQQQHHRRNGRSKLGNRQSTVTDGAHHQVSNDCSLSHSFGHHFDSIISPSLSYRIASWNRCRERGDRLTENQPSPSVVHCVPRSLANCQRYLTRQKEHKIELEIYRRVSSIHDDNVNQFHSLHRRFYFVQ